VSWTWNEVNSLEAGVSGKKEEGSQYIRLTAVWVVVNYSISGSHLIDVSGIFTVDLSTYPLSEIDSVEIQLRYKANDTGEAFYLEAFNWTAGLYGDDGFNNTSGHLPTGDWDFYTVNLTDRWASYVGSNGTMHIKFQDNQADANCTTIDIDFLAIRLLIDGILITFRNQGSLTCHLVSLWINNATDHRRYDIDIFINAGATLPFFSNQIVFPETPFLVKAITERGNIATYLVE
jgi:hypothetical protein